MNYNQNEKIAQITSRTLIIGVDIAKYKHVARAQDFRGLEFSAPYHFENTIGRDSSIKKIAFFRYRARLFSIGIFKERSLN